MSSVQFFQVVSMQYDCMGGRKGLYRECLKAAVMALAVNASGVEAVFSAPVWKLNVGFKGFVVRL